MPGPDSFVQLLLTRLERLSADSPLAHRASGLRGSLLRSLEQRASGMPVDQLELDRTLNAALEVLQQAATAARTGWRRRR